MPLDEMPTQMVLVTPAAGLGFPASSTAAWRRKETKSREVR